MIDRVRLSASARNQLITLKRKTGLEYNNSICRYALCLSLENESLPPQEVYSFNGGVGIDWRTFTGGNEELYWNLLVIRMGMEGREPDDEGVRYYLTAHLHRGLSFLSAKSEAELQELFSDLV